MPTSSDGQITAVVHAGFPGVLLRATLPAGAASATFSRKDEAGATVTVRSGAAVPLTGDTATDTAIAYDLDAPFGLSSYTVNGSAPVEVYLVSDRVWLKSILSPSLSRPVLVSEFPALSRPGRLTVESVLGSRFPAVSAQTRSAGGGTLVLQAVTTAEKDDLVALLSAPGALLLQQPGAYGRDDAFCAVADLSWSQQGKAASSLWLVTASLVEVKRPATVGYPLMIPGWTWADVAAAYASAGAVATAHATVWDLLVFGVS